MHIGQRIQALMKQRGISTSKMAEHCGVSRGAVSNWFATGRISKDNLVKAAQLLGVSTEALIAGDVGERDAPPPAPLLPDEAIPFRPRLQRVWVCGTCQGGIPDRVWEGSWKEMAQEYAEVASADPEAFLCEVEGNSMAPRYMPREFALIEPGTTPEIEDDVLVRLKSGETMLKRLLGRRSGIRLGSYNDSEIFTFTEDQVEWMYYCAHPVPRRKIKRREDSPDAH